MFIAMLKRDLRLFLRGLLPALVLTALLGALCAGAAAASGKGAEDVFAPIRAAVVDEEDSLLSRMLVSAVGEMDYIAPLLSLERMERSEAEQALRDGQLAAVIILPRYFVEDITQGLEGGGQILLSPTAATHAQVVEAVTRCGELLLAAGQCGVFAGEALLREAGITGDVYRDFLSRANLSLLEEAAGAGSGYFRLTVTDYAGTALPTAAWFGCGWLTLMLFLCSMFFTELYRRDVNRPMLSRLQAAGVRRTAFLWGKLLLPVVFRWVLLLPVLVLLPVPTAGAVLSALAAAAAAGVMGCAAILCLRSGPALVAVLSLAGLFLCGGIVPRQMLPQALLTAGSLTPFGAVNSLLCPAFGAPAPLSGVLLTLLYTAAALGLTLLALKRLSAGGERP